MAGYKKSVYCDFDFLKQLRRSNGCLSPFGNNDAMRMWLNALNLLCKSKVQLNIDVKTFQGQIRKRTGDTLFELWKRVANGESEISFLEEHNVKFYENRLASPEGVMYAYLVNEKRGVVNHLGKKYGVVTITPDCWKGNEAAREKAYLFKDCGWAVKKGESKSWGEMLRSGEYRLSDCNSMIIIDNYILKNNIVIEKNLYPILKVLLPPELDKNIEFHLSIITEDNHAPHQDFGGIYISIRRKIEEMFPNLRLKFDLYVTSGIGEFHDRTIITNNVIISCGGGFDLINSRGKISKNTEWRILHQGIHVCDGATDESYSNIISTALSVIERIKAGNGGRYYPQDSEFRNRIFTQSGSNHRDY